MELPLGRLLTKSSVLETKRFINCTEPYTELNSKEIIKQNDNLLKKKCNACFLRQLSLDIDEIRLDYVELNWIRVDFINSKFRNYAVPALQLTKINVKINEYMHKCI